MNNVIEQMLNKYSIQNTKDEINALKEVIQEIILFALYKEGFFEKAAFYGGTALRIFYNLDRFSEDLDFALLEKNSNFDLSVYFNAINEELSSYGLNLIVSQKNKKLSSNITTAFVKGNTLELILKFFPLSNDHKYNKILKDLKIKFEVDINPPAGAKYNVEYKLLPEAHIVRLYEPSSLFAGKVHAILCRNWTSRVKGRDLYDYIFFLANNTLLNLDLLNNKLIESGFINYDEKIDINKVKEILKIKFKDINFDEAKNDVIPFIKNTTQLNLWNYEFFENITDNIHD